MTDKLSSLISSLHEARQMKAAADKAEKAILADLKPLVDPMFEKLPDSPVIEDGLALTRISSVSRSISAEKLLERGVSPDIIAHATNTVPYFQYRIKEAK